MNGFLQRTIRLSAKKTFLPSRASAPVFASAARIPSTFRFYSAGPEKLSVQQIEDRVLTLLKEFDKVQAEKVR